MKHALRILLQNAIAKGHTNRAAAMLIWLSWICLGATAAGCVYALAATAAVLSFARRSAAAAERFPSVTIMKPLRGAEPSLYQALASFCVQDYPAPVQILCGTSQADDPCVTVVHRLMGDLPACDLELIIDGQVNGANNKVSNFINLERRIRHELVVVSDSDISVQPDYLRRIAEGFSDRDVGLVTCLYRGDAQAGLWSRLSAMAIDYQFLPSVLIGVRLRLAHPCLGSTMALMHTTLQRIGGFRAFANQLADDYAIGAAVRNAGMEIGIGAPVVAHSCYERQARDLFGHELRWARTIRAIDPRGFAGSFITYPLPFALLYAALSGFGAMGWLAICATIVCRLAVMQAVDRCIPGTPTNRWLLPLRDLLSFAIFVASFFVAVVSWRGQRYRVLPDGTLAPLNETAS
jgi:ceramide glucosyltransferase